MNIPHFQKPTRIDNFFKGQAVKIILSSSGNNPNLDIGEDKNRYALFYAMAQQLGPNFRIFVLYGAPLSRPL